MGTSLGRPQSRASGRLRALSLPFNRQKSGKLLCVANDPNQKQKTIFVGSLAIAIVVSTTILLVTGKQVPSWFEAVIMVGIGFMVGKGT